MIRIFLKTIWNQRSKNILIFIEMLLIFLVISNLSIYYTNLISILRTPNCYQHENVVIVTINSHGEGPEEVHFGIHLKNLKMGLTANEFVEAVSISQMAAPFNYSLSSSVYKYGDESFSSAHRSVDIDYGRVMNINVLKGRWFNETDRGKKITPVVLGMDIEEETFDGEAVSKRFGEDNYEVVGVVGAFKRSDIEKPYPSCFHLKDIKDSSSYYSMDFLIRVKKEQAQYLITQPLHESQEIVEEKKEEIIFELKVHPTYEFKAIILGLGSDVRIMEPSDLKDEIISVLHEALEGYSSN